MAKNKDKPQTINNIGELNIEIDYDKLAEAIVKAQDKVNKQPKTCEKTGFWKAVWLIIRNKERKNGNKTAVLLSEVMAYMFNMIAICSLILLVLIIVGIFVGFAWSNAPIELMKQIVILSFILGLLPAIAFVFRCIANEIRAEKDRNYIVSVFSGLVSFAALIVALVALFKGVG